MCALTTYRKSLTVTNTLVALDFNFTTDIACDFAAEITLDFVVSFDVFTKLCKLCFLQIFNASIWRNSSCLQRFVGTGKTIPKI
jgi:hypothetical protein